MTNTQRHTCREAVKLLRDRCTEARTDTLKRSDIAYGLKTLLESETVTAALSPGRLGQLEHLKKMLDVSEAEHSPQTIKDLQGALNAFLDEELGRFGEKKERNHMARRRHEEEAGRFPEEEDEEEEANRCEACGHENPLDDEEEADRPEPTYASDGIRRGASLNDRTNRTAYSKGDLDDDGDADGMGETSELEAMKAASYANGHAKYDGEESRRLRSQQHTSHHAARLALAEQDGFKKYQKEARVHKKAMESLRGVLRQSFRERVVIVPRGATSAARAVESLDWR